MAFSCTYHADVTLPDKFSTCWRCVNEFFTKHGMTYEPPTYEVSLDDIIEEDEPVGGSVQEAMQGLDRILDRSAPVQPSQRAAMVPTIEQPAHPQRPSGTLPTASKRVSFGVGE